jgi:hypothetical protein
LSGGAEKEVAYVQQLSLMNFSSPSLLISYSVHQVGESIIICPVGYADIQFPGSSQFQSTRLQTDELSGII